MNGARQGAPRAIDAIRAALLSVGAGRAARDGTPDIDKLRKMIAEPRRSVNRVDHPRGHGEEACQETKKG